jgi:hypothetical protein
VIRPLTLKAQKHGAAGFAKILRFAKEQERNVDLCSAQFSGLLNELR